jgi:hypothetical protein
LLYYGCTCFAVWQWGTHNGEHGWKQVTGSGNSFSEDSRRRLAPHWTQISSRKLRTVCTPHTLPYIIYLRTILALKLRHYAWVLPTELASSVCRRNTPGEFWVNVERWHRQHV